MDSTQHEHEPGQVLTEAERSHAVKLARAMVAMGAPGDGEDATVYVLSSWVLRYERSLTTAEEALRMARDHEAKLRPALEKIAALWPLSLQYAGTQLGALYSIPARVMKEVRAALATTPTTAADTGAAGGEHGIDEADAEVERILTASPEEILAEFGEDAERHVAEMRELVKKAVDKANSQQTAERKEE